MVYKTLIQNLYSFQCQHESDIYWDSLDLTNVTVWIPDPRLLSRRQLLHYHKRPHNVDKDTLLLGTIHCYDTLSLDLISNLGKEAIARTTSTDFNKNDPSYNLWWRFLVHGCYLASTIRPSTISSFNNSIFASKRPRTIVLQLTLDTNYVQHSLQKMDMIGYRFSWRVAVKEDMMAFASVYFSVLGGAYSSLGKSNQKYAFKAGALAKRQIKLARWHQDAELESKCWLYYAEDMVMQGRFKKARRILDRQRLVADRLQNNTLVTMCDSVLLKWQTATSTLDTSFPLDNIPQY